MSFAAVEALSASAAAALFVNFHLIKGTYAFAVTLDRGVEQIGEYNLSGERRDRISLLKSTAAAAGLAGGATVSPDPAHYSVGELAAMVPANWVIDRKDADDGHIVSYWLK